MDDGQVVRRTAECPLETGLQAAGFAALDLPTTIALLLSCELHFHDNTVSEHSRV